MLNDIDYDLSVYALGAIAGDSRLGSSNLGNLDAIFAPVNIIKAKYWTFNPMNTLGVYQVETTLFDLYDQPSISGHSLLDDYEIFTLSFRNSVSFSRFNPTLTISNKLSLIHI